MIGQWLSNNETTIFTIILILVAAWLINVFGGVFVKNTVRRSIKSGRHADYHEEKKREDTIIHIITGALSLLIWPMAVLLIISKLGVNIAPLIAGAGILGLAVGFGAQSLVKDVINGLFIIAENQYRVGDVVKLNSSSIGMVENISLRATVLRDLDGVVTTLPNGNIELTANYSKDHSGINLDIGVSYEADLDKVIAVINKTCQSLTKDKDWSEKIIETPKFLRVDDFAESSVILKITGTVRPLAQWEVAGELRKRLKLAFDKAGIEIPYPQREIHTKK